MATRSSSNKGTDRRALNVPPPARNTQDNTQAVRRMPGVGYGEQQALVEQQQAAPLPKAGVPQAQARPTRPKIDLTKINAFGPTERPNEPVTSGLPFGPGYTPQQDIQDDPDMILRVLYNVYPDPIFLQMMNRQDFG